MARALLSSLGGWREGREFKRTDLSATRSAGWLEITFDRQDLRSMPAEHLIAGIGVSFLKPYAIFEMD